MDRTLRPSSNNRKDEGLFLLVVGVRPIMESSESSSEHSKTEKHISAADRSALRLVSAVSVEQGA